MKGNYLLLQYFLIFNSQFSIILLQSKGFIWKNDLLSQLFCRILFQF